MNRVADLELLPEIQLENAEKVFQRVVSSDSNVFNQKLMESFKNAKHVQIEDIFETFTLQFEIYYPISDDNDIMKIIGDGLTQLGDVSMNISSSAAPQPFKMLKSEYKIWL